MRLWLAGLCLLPLSASSQLSPVYSYNGIKRPFLVNVHGLGADSEIDILAPVSATVWGRAAVTKSVVDLSKLFSDLWTNKTPHLMYAQLVVNGKKVGPAMVMQPMTNPAISKLGADGKSVVFEPDEDASFSGYRAWVDSDILLETTAGNIRFRMRPDCAPNTVWNISQLVLGGFYRDVIWHRVVPVARGNPFVIQTGDPTGTGSGGPGWAYPLEDSKLPHDFGVLSIARSTDPNTNGSQFFVALSREGTARLDHKYASFGEAISGTDVILKIAAVKTGKDDRPDKPPVIRRARLVPAAPYGTGPKPVKRPVAQPAP